jgi:hypothetical protein
MANRSVTPGKLYAGAGVCCALGLACAYLFYNTWRYEQWMKSWPTANGSILSCSIEQGISGTIGNEARSGTLRPAYSIKVQYSYTAGGKQYTGGQFSNNPPKQILSKPFEEPNAQMIALRDRYPAGTPVKIHHDPEHPETSYLEFRSSGGLYFMSGLAAFFFLLGIVLWLRRDSRAPR